MKGAVWEQLPATPAMNTDCLCKRVAQVPERWMQPKRIPAGQNSWTSHCGTEANSIAATKVLQPAIQILALGIV
jgi:hypothetical protein